MTSIGIVLKNGRSFCFEGQMPKGWKQGLLEMWQQRNGIWEVGNKQQTLLVDVAELAGVEAQEIDSAQGS